MGNNSNYHITHSPQAQRFFVQIDGHMAYLSYKEIDKNTLDYHHTIVPPALSGQGIGTQLVKYALEYANAQNKKVIPSCSFVAHHLAKQA